MATLNSSNISNGNVIEPNDLLQLYDALTPGGGTTGEYNISISGSLTGSATTALNASKLNPSINASTNANYNVLFAATSSATYEEVYKENGTIMTYNPSTNLLNVTSSRAVTASFALNGGVADQIVSQGYSNIAAGPVEATFKFYAGKVRMVTNSGTTADFPGLAGKTLGTNVWVTATIQGQASSFTAPNLVTVRSLSANGAITIETASVPDTTEVHFHVIYVP
jgi:hypothetical protein